MRETQEEQPLSDTDIPRYSAILCWCLVLFAIVPLLAQQPDHHHRLPTFPLPDGMVQTPADNRSAIGNQALLKAAGESPEAITAAQVDDQQNILDPAGVAIRPCEQP